MAIVKAKNLATGGIFDIKSEELDTIYNPPGKPKNWVLVNPPTTTTTATTISPTITAPQTTMPIISSVVTTIPSMTATKALETITPTKQLEQYPIGTDWSNPNAPQGWGVAPSGHFVKKIEPPLKPLPNKNLYIGETNWKKLQQQYTPAQLEYATTKIGKDIYWNPEKHIEDYGKTVGETIGGTTGEVMGDMTNATDVMKIIGLPEIPSETELMQKVLDSPEFKLYMQKVSNQGLSLEAQAEAAKDILDTKYEADKTNLENKLADYGLSFSGIRPSQVKALADSLASSKLGIDRELASKVLELDTNLMDKTLDLVSDVIKEAQTGRKEYLDLLKDQGLTFDPITGNLVPTLAAKTAALAEQREERVAAVEEERLKMETTRLNLAIGEANKPNIKFEVANGRNWMITYDDNGNIIKKQDLGNAYKTTGGGISTGNVGQWVQVLNQTGAQSLGKIPAKIYPQVLTQYYSQVPTYTQWAEKNNINQSNAEYFEQYSKYTNDFIKKLDDNLNPPKQTGVEKNASDYQVIDGLVAQTKNGYDNGELNYDDIFAEAQRLTDLSDSEIRYQLSANGIQW